MNCTILAGDLGKFNLVLGRHEPATRGATFRAVKPVPGELRRGRTREPIRA